MMLNKNFSFNISCEEMEKIREWKKEHIKNYHNENHIEGAIGGRFSYEFIPTSLGEIGIIKCACGKDFCFRDI